MRQLETTLAGTACTVLLTDPHGVVVHAARPREYHGEVLMPLAGRVGVNLAEESIGTNAPGLTARTGLPSLVLGAEHFFGCVQVMRCAAAPIRDVRGQVAGVLDVSSESRPFGFDAAAVVGIFATAIENRLLRAQSIEHVVVHLQTSPSLLNTPMEGLVGVAADGRIAWANGVAARLLGIASFGSGLVAEEVFALGLQGLASLSRRREAEPHRLPSGLNVWMTARIQSPDGAGPVVRLNPGSAEAGAHVASGCGADSGSRRDRASRMQRPRPAAPFEPPPRHPHARRMPRQRVGRGPQTRRFARPHLPPPEGRLTRVEAPGVDAARGAPAR